MKMKFGFALFFFLSLIGSQNVFSQTPTTAVEDRALKEQAESINEIVARALQVSDMGTPDFNEGAYYATIHQGISLQAGRLESKGRAGVDKAQPEFGQIQPDLDTIENFAQSKEERDKIDAILKLSPKFRILNGWIAPKDVFQSTVALALNFTNAACTGVVVEKGVIVTAGHCFCTLAFGKKINNPESFSQISVRFANPELGEHTFQTAVTGGKILDPGLCDDLRNDRPICSLDLAVLTYNPGETPSGLKLASIPDPEDANRFVSRGGRTVTLVGFGQTRDPKFEAHWSGSKAVANANQTANKMVGIVPIYKNCNKERACSAKTHGCVLGADLVIQDRIFKDASKKIGSCFGDSGGPVFYTPTSESTNVVYDNTLLAITSRPSDPRGFCGPGAIYTRVYTKQAREFLATYIE